MSFTHCALCGEPWSGHLTACAPRWESLPEFPLTHDDHVFKLAMMDYRQMELKILAALAVPAGMMLGEKTLSEKERIALHKWPFGFLYGQENKSVEKKEEAKSRRPFQVGDLIECEFVTGLDTAGSLCPRWNFEVDYAKFKKVETGGWYRARVTAVDEQQVAAVFERPGPRSGLCWRWPNAERLRDRAGWPRHVEDGRRLPATTGPGPESYLVHPWWTRRSVPSTAVADARLVHSTGQLRKALSKVERLLYQGSISNGGLRLAAECLADHGQLPRELEMDVGRRRRAPHEDWD